MELSLSSGSCALVHNHRCTDHVLLFQNGTFRKQPTSGDAPSSRGLHAATMLDKNRMILFGGAAQDGKMSNELFVLDIRTWKWKKMKFDDGGDDDDEHPVMPSPRAAPCLASLTDGCVILFGGAEAKEQGLNPRADLWCFEIDDDGDGDSGAWSLLLDDDKGPSPRNAATLMVMDTQSVETILGNGEISDCGSCNKKYFLLQGGWAPFKVTFSEPSILSVQFVEEGIV